jgi:hypothetical protein
VSPFLLSSHQFYRSSSLIYPNPEGEFKGLGVCGPAYTTPISSINEAGAKGINYQLYNLAPLKTKRYHTGCMPRGKKNANGEGSKARRRKYGRYETRAVLVTPAGRKRVSFYGATAKEANEKKAPTPTTSNRLLSVASVHRCVVTSIASTGKRLTIRSRIPTISQFRQS